MGVIGRLFRTHHVPPAKCPRCGAVLRAATASWRPGSTASRWERLCLRCGERIVLESPVQAEQIQPPATERDADPIATTSTRHERDVEAATGAGAQQHPAAGADLTPLRRELELTRELLDEVRHQRDHLEAQLASVVQCLDDVTVERAELLRLVNMLLTQRPGHTPPLLVPPATWPLRATARDVTGIRAVP